MTESSRATLASRRAAKENDENETRDLPHGSKPRSPGMEPSNQAGRTAPGLQSYRFEKKTARFQRQSPRETVDFPASRRVGFRVIAIARKNERCEETDARARVPSATENLSRATYLFLGAAHDLLRRRSLSRRRRLLRRGLLDRRLRRRSLRLEHDDRRESSWCAAHRTFAVVASSLRPSRTRRSIDRWNIPIGTDGIPMERPDRGIGTDRTPRSNAPIQIQIEIETGAEIGGSVTHTQRRVVTRRSIWIGAFNRGVRSGSG